MTHPRAELENSFMNHVASDPQRLAYQGAVDLSYSPMAVETASSNAGLRAKRHEKRTTAQLLYDSFAQPATAGTRSMAMRVRQMLFRAGPYQIDVQVEVQPGRNGLVVTGQLIDVGHAGLLDAGIEVTLSDGRGNMVNTITNQFGEFRGEVILSGDLEISFQSRDGKPVAVLLRGTLDPGLMEKN